MRRTSSNSNLAKVQGKNTLQPIKPGNNKKNDVKVIIKQSENASKRIVEDLRKNNPNILIGEDYTKNFINFDIKIDEKNNTKEKSVYSNSKINTESGFKKKDIHNYLKLVENDILESGERINKMKEELINILLITDQKSFNNSNISKTSNKTSSLKGGFDSPTFFEVNLLKSELINVKMKNEFLRMQNKFYENIFFTCKNTIENLNTDQNNNNLRTSTKDNINYTNEINNFKNEVKSKLNCIFTQNNKYYYDYFSSKSEKEIQSFDFNHKENNGNKLNNPNLLIKIENELSLVMKELNNFSSLQIDKIPPQDYINYTFQLKDLIITNLKSILSYYILEDNFNIQFSHRNSFFLENGDKFANLETKQRTEKIIEDISEFIKPNLNRVMTNKFKKDLLEKIQNICNFYENFNKILKTENLGIKYNTSIFTQNSMLKVGNVTKLVDNFLIYSEECINKLKELIDLSRSKSVKSLDKVVFSFVKNEEANFVSLCEKYEELNKNYHLVK